MQWLTSVTNQLGLTRCLISKLPGDYRHEVQHTNIYDYDYYRRNKETLYAYAC